MYYSMLRHIREKFPFQGLCGCHTAGVKRDFCRDHLYLSLLVLPFCQECNTIFLPIFVCNLLCFLKELHKKTYSHLDKQVDVIFCLLSCFFMVCWHTLCCRKMAFLFRSVGELQTRLHFTEDVNNWIAALCFLKSNWALRSPFCTVGLLKLQMLNRPQLTESLGMLQKLYEQRKPLQLFAEVDLHFSLKKSYTLPTCVISVSKHQIGRQFTWGSWVPAAWPIKPAVLSCHPHNRVEHWHGFLISNVGPGSLSHAHTAKRSGSNSPGNKTEGDSSQFCFCLLKLMQVTEPQKTSIMSKCVC